jgi:hypothetical protein
MIKSVVLIWAFLLFRSFMSTAQNLYDIKLGSHSKISVISTSPGEELYTAFGHVAIRVLDPTHSLDLVFGYGNFDFNTPNFYPEFVRGTLLYSISVEPFDLFRQEFMDQPYQMYEQVLCLDSFQKAKIFSLLITNYEPANRLYRYDFFYDNCSTRVRDIIMKGIDQPTLFSKSASTSAVTFRDLLKTYLIHKPWVRLGTDLILGVPADKKISPYEQSFLPLYLSVNLNSLNTSRGSKLKLCSESYLMSKMPAPSFPSLFSPSGIFWLLALISLLSILHPLSERIFSGTCYTLYGLLGMIMIYLWIGTERTSFGLNFNIFWASPILISIPYLRGKTRMFFSFLSIVFISALFVIMAFGIQVFNPAVFPLIFMLLPHLLKASSPIMGRLFLRQTNN